jgi:hypothetical protein
MMGYWREFDVTCLKGAETNSLYYVRVWATSWREAHAQCRAMGYIPECRGVFEIYVAAPNTAATQ